MTLHPQAAIALHAVDLRATRGRQAAWKYASSRGAGSLYTLARVLDAARKAGY